MARFVFRLQAVLATRERERGQRRSELATAVQAETVLAESCQQIELELDLERHNSMSTAADGSLDLVRLQTVAGYQLALRGELKRLSAEHQAALDEVDQLIAAEHAVRVAREHVQQL